ncbi:phage tail terminator family protein [Paenibacillus sinopodophylli]|uniref:phage tail terminator family protein n=1 Tax=Paenibacillus sinopodophylli TaxID=1837342 RepID=UPI00110D189C|nr:hypothetical protein [Paenibacillus sinopodophylli]
MVTVTVNSIRDGLIAALDTHFPDIPILGEEIKQGLDGGFDIEEPCFFVKQIIMQQNALLGPRSQRSQTFDIHFFADDNKNRSMHNMAEHLYEHLEWIVVDGVKYRGTGMNHEIVNEIMHFNIDYKLHVVRQQAQDPTMQTMKQEVRIHGE